MYLFMEFSAIEEVEDLHHDECIENKSEMSRINMEFLEDWHVVMFSIDVV